LPAAADIPASFYNKITYVGANTVGDGIDSVYSFVTFKPTLPQCMTVIGYMITNVNPPGKITYPSNLCKSSAQSCI
jgi:hypothetical protein